MYDDCDAAWDLLDHNELGVHAHKQTGCTLDLDGLEDHLIYRDLKPLLVREGAGHADYQAETDLTGHE